MLHSSSPPSLCPLPRLERTPCQGRASVIVVVKRNAPRLTSVCTREKLGGTRTLRAAWKNATWKTISPKNKPGRNALFARCVYRHHTEMRSSIPPRDSATRLTSSATYRTNDRLLSNTPLFQIANRARREWRLPNERRKLTKRSRHVFFFFCESVGS